MPSTQTLLPDLVAADDSFTSTSSVLPTYFFALNDGSTVSFGPEHQREDLKVFEFHRTLAEADFPTLDLVVENPFTGLLNLPQWIWFSYDDGSEVVPLFFGRLVDIPSNLQDTVITMTYRGEPQDYEAQRIAYAAGLRVLPMYDELFVDDAHVSNPDAVLEGYSATWYVDPITMVVSVSDIIVGEDGTIGFTLDDGTAFYDGLEQGVDGKPITSSTVVAEVAWTQAATGSVDFGSFQLPTLNPSSLFGSWPRPGTELSAGWSVDKSTIHVPQMYDPASISFSISWTNQSKRHEIGDTMSFNESFNGVLGQSGPPPHTMQYGYSIVVGDTVTGTPGSAHQEWQGVSVGGALEYTAHATLLLKYKANRQRTERITLTLTADAQPVLRAVDSGDSAETTDNISGRDVSLALPNGSGAPIVYAGRSEYFPTDRGLESVKHMICRARAKVLSGMRIGRTKWQGEFVKVATVTCRHNALLEDSRIPGGSVIGKVTEVNFDGNGDTGEFIGEVTIKSAIGEGNSVVEVRGTPTYVDDGVLDDGIQEMSGSTFFALPVGDVGFTPPIAGQVDDGLVFPLTSADAGSLIVRQEVKRLLGNETKTDEQTPFSDGDLSSPPAENTSSKSDLNLTESAGQRSLRLQTEQAQSFVDQMNKRQVWTEIEIKSVVGGPYGQEWTVVCTDLMVPKQIDLRGED